MASRRKRTGRWTGGKYTGEFGVRMRPVQDEQYRERNRRPNGLLAQIGVPAYVGTYFGITSDGRYV